MKQAIEKIIETTAQEFGVFPMAIKGNSKTEAISFPRMAAIYLAWRYMGAADLTVAYYFNRKKGSSVRHARQTVPTLIETTKAFRKAYRNIEEKLKNTEL